MQHTSDRQKDEGWDQDNRHPGAAVAVFVVMPAEILPSSNHDKNGTVESWAMNDRKSGVAVVV